MKSKSKQKKSLKQKIEKFDETSNNREKKNNKN